MKGIKKVGKAALKAAPVAAMFIPGIGPVAAGAIGGISGLLSKKIEGGSWGQALQKGVMSGLVSAGGKMAVQGAGRGLRASQRRGLGKWDTLKNMWKGVKSQPMVGKKWVKDAEGNLVPSSSWKQLASKFGPVAAVAETGAAGAPQGGAGVAMQSISGPAARAGCSSDHWWNSGDGLVLSGHVW
jgi:hypothetical protein